MMNLARIVIGTVDRHCIRGTLRPSIRHCTTTKRTTNCKSIGVRLPMDAKYDNTVFLKSYPRIISELTTNDDDSLNNFFKHFTKLLEHNLPKEILAHGLVVVNTYKILHKNPQPITEENMYLAQVIGWAFEILRGFIIIVDDFVDNSDLRYGNLCWYKNSDIGSNAVVDGILMYSRLFDVLKKYFHNKPYHAQLIGIIHEVCWEAYVGESLSLQLATKFRKTRSWTEFTFENHKKMAAMNTMGMIYGPIAAPMLMHGIMDDVAYAQAKYVASLMARFYTEQGDVLDVFGAASETGKLPTDIQEGKCTWLVLTALQICHSEQAKILHENYGKRDGECVERVRNVFFELRLDDIYRKHADTFYEQILNIIEGPDFKLPSAIFTYCLDFLHERECA